MILALSLVRKTGEYLRKTGYAVSVGFRTFFFLNLKMSYSKMTHLKSSGGSKTFCIVLKYFGESLFATVYSLKNSPE
jgi:hypothetical protein